MERKIQLDRKTKETDISIKLNIDGRGDTSIETKVGFFDHLLTQIAVHGSFDLDIKARGDLNIDTHHLIEDTAILLGKAFKKALGKKIGINRVSHCFFPMDDVLVFIAIDISSRPFFTSEINWVNPYLGSKEDNLIPVDLIEHFLYTFAIQAKITLHVKLFSGINNHHIAEGIFKALGRTLDYASRLDPKRRDIVPSSKGTL